MKKTVFTLMLTIGFTTLFAQKNPFEKFTDMDGVRSVYISKTMLSIMPMDDIEGVNINDFIKNKLSAILILTSEDKAIAKDMLSVANEYVKRDDYKLLMKVKSDENVNFFMKGEPENISELIMTVASRDGENVIMQFLGDFTLDDIKTMTKNF